MTRVWMLLAGLIMTMQVAWADEAGLISKKSPYSVKKTLTRLENVLRSKGMTVVKRWSHDSSAKKAGVTLRPTEVLLFANPKLNTHLMIDQQTVGIDLPMKALAWLDDQGQVWLTYNDPQYIAKRHGIQDKDEVLQKMAAVLNEMTDAAIAK